MSIIREHTAVTLTDAWRTIDIDALIDDHPRNFDTSTLRPTAPPGTNLTEPEARQLNAQVRQLLRGGDAEGALRGCLESPVYGDDAAARDVHLQTVVEVLQSIKASDMTPMLQRIYADQGGSECLDVLMKYLYKGMAALGSAQGGSSSRGTPSRVTPQLTGFSQVTGRPGATNESAGAAMSVLLSWHEKVVDVAGLGCICRCMTDWRRV